MIIMSEHDVELIMNLKIQGGDDDDEDATDDDEGGDDDVRLAHR